MSGGGRLLTIIRFRSPVLGLGLREKVVGVEESGGVGPRGKVFGLGLPIMEEIMSEGLGLATGFTEDVGEEDESWRGWELSVD